MKLGNEEKLVELNVKLEEAIKRLGEIDKRIGDMVALSGLPELRDVAADAVAEITAQVIGVEEEMSNLAKATFEVDGQKQYDLCYVRETKTVSFPDDKALEYAKESLPVALKLDRRKFGKLAPVLDLPFVTITTETKTSFRREEIASRARQACQEGIA